MTIEVSFIDSMGDDLSVVNAARVSFDKESEWDTYYSSPEGGNLPCISEKDAKLIKYLVKHDHWSPFSHCYIKLRVKAPIFVARQLQKHTVGLAWNEVSRRYVDNEPTLYAPEAWRKRAENVKQGSSEETVDLSVWYAFEHATGEWLDDYTLDELEQEVRERSVVLYNSLLRAGVCPEQARMVLPQSMLTEWIWSGSLMAFARVCKLRLDSHTQAETREVAKQIANHCQTYFPVSWDALLGEAHGAGTVSNS